MLCKFLLHVVLAGTTIASSRGLPSADQKERRQAQGQGQAFTGSSQDGLKQGNGTCKDNIIVYARGTLEPGNVGLFVGPPIFKAVADRVGESNLAVQGVDYPASLVGFRAGGDALGSIATASLVTQAVTQCPRSKVVMMGFSQGAMLMHNAAVALPANISAKVAAAVLFGDPFNGTAIAGIPKNKTLVLCHDDDIICQNSTFIVSSHLSYGTVNAGQAVDFIEKAPRPS